MRVFGLPKVRGRREQVIVEKFILVMRVPYTVPRSAGPNKKGGGRAAVEVENYVVFVSSDLSGGFQTRFFHIDLYFGLAFRTAKNFQQFGAYSHFIFSKRFSSDSNA